MQEGGSSSDGFVMAVKGAWIRREGPIVFGRPEGPITLEMNLAVSALLEQVKRECGRVYLLMDASKVTEMSAERRAWVAKHVNEGIRPSALVVFGATFQMRVVGTLFTRLVKLINPPGLRVQFCSTEAEARAYIAELDKAYMGER